MRILVTGSAGTVGSYAANVFADDRLLLTDRATWDVTDPDPGIHWVPDVVLHLAAATDVDACELDPDLAYRTNAIGTLNVAAACERWDADLVYVSTAGVFGGDGAPGPFTEFNPPCPANVYGRSKLAGETLAAEQTRRLYVVRAGWMFGGDPQTDPKFVGKIARQINAGKIIRAVGDKTGSPTYARDLLVGIRDLLELRAPYGIYHMANAGTATRHEMAIAIGCLYGESDTTITEAVPSSAFPLPAPRADSEAMRSYKAELLGLPVPRPWQDALAEHLSAAVSAAA